MQKFYNYFLAKYLQDDHVNFSRAKLIFNFCAITAIFSFFYALIAHLIRFEASTVTMPIIGVLFVVLSFLLRFGISLGSVIFLYLLLSFIAAVLLISQSGMLHSSIVPWLAFIPMAANLLSGTRQAFFWFILTTATILVMIYVSPDREGVNIMYEPEYDNFFVGVVYIGLVAIILTLSMIFQKSKDRYLALLQQKNELISDFNRQLKSKNDEIVSQNEELKQQKEEIIAQREFIEGKNKELLAVQDELNDIIDKLTSTQSTLAKREAENRGILEAIYGTQLLVGELDLEGRVIKMSSITMQFLQMSPDELIGKPFVEISKKLNLRFGESRNFRTVWSEVLNGKHSSHEIYLNINDRSYWLKENFFPILNEKGEATKVMVVAQDITQLKNQKYEIEALNDELTNKIKEIERQNSLLLKQRKEIELVNEKISRSNEEIKNINATLEKRVAERTKNLQEKNIQLAEYAYINSHLLRGPLCSILGLVNLLESSNHKEHEKVVYHMRKSSDELKDVVNRITRAIEDGSHFDRKLLLEN